MSNPSITNSGASAYLGMLSTLAGNPEVLTKEHLENSEVKEKLKTFYTGLERSSGSEDFLEELFLKGDYESVFTYESSIININKKLESQGKETLYALYPVDGVAISDSPLAYIDKKNENKKEIFKDIQNYILSDDCSTLKSGIFVAGDCRNKNIRQLTTAVSDGALAASIAIKNMKGE